MKGPEISHAETDSAESGAAEAAKLLRVRDLLFGDAERAQTQRVDALEILIESEFARLASDFESRLRSYQEEIRSELNEVAARVDSQGRDKVKRADLGKALTELGQRLGESERSTE